MYHFWLNFEQGIIYSNVLFLLSFRERLPSLLPKQVKSPANPNGSEHWVWDSVQIRGADWSRYPSQALGERTTEGKSVLFMKWDQESEHNTQSLKKIYWRPFCLKSVGSSSLLLLLLLLWKSLIDGCCCTNGPKTFKKCKLSCLFYPTKENYSIKVLELLHLIFL